MDLEIKPIKSIEYTSKQSKFEHCGKLPIRSVVLGASGSGKTVLLVNMILKLYRNCFERIYIFSPSINVDMTWQPVKEYIEDKNLSNGEEIYFDHYDSEALEEIINNQKQIIEYLKRKKHKKMYNILILIDDFADNPSFSRHSKLLHSLYTRGRHSFISVVTATQKFNAIASIIRVNATELYVYRLRNYKDLEALLEELTALYPKKVIQKLYDYATEKPYSFLYINLMSKDKKNMFYMNLTKKLSIEEI